MGGHDPYSSSKGCSELITNSYRDSFWNSSIIDRYQKGISSVRAGNVIGGGDWHANNLIASCIIALENKQTIKIRNPEAIRPWQYVLDALHGYLLLASKMYEKPTEFSDGWNFGPNQDSVTNVESIVNKVITQWQTGSWDNMENKKSYHEANTLLIDNTKAQIKLKWKPTMDIDQMINNTIDWYRVYNEMDMYQFCEDQIRLFINKV
jgi:CDP-glucose 4,6-dehydratase